MDDWVGPIHLVGDYVLQPFTWPPTRFIVCATSSRELEDLLPSID